ncbi:hypothetical protein FHG87_002792 [Trinorchestia longiramus]|nr:hypothetical protein FHG87_002792 [Trinorchestia longiramus]
MITVQRVLALALIVTVPSITRCQSSVDTSNLLPYSVRDGMSSSEYCNKIQGECRLKAYREKSDGTTHFEVSCYCYYRQEDVSGPLDDLIERPCPLVPRAGQRVTHATLNITQCYVQSQTIPLPLMTALRRSEHMHVHISQSFPLRFPLLLDSMVETGLTTINVEIIKSKVSGIDRGFASGSKQLRFLASRSDIGVISADAFTSPDYEDVSITIQDSNITKFMTNSVRLPASGRLLINNSRISSLDGGSVTGSGDLSLISSTIGVISKGSLNMLNLSKLEVKDCIVATVEEQAVINRRYALSNPTTGFSFVANNTDGTPLTGDENDESLGSKCHAIFEENRFVEANSQAFSQMCKAAQVTWNSNEFIEVSGGPVVLEDSDCPLPASSIISTTKLQCSNCSFLNPSDDKICPIYVNSWCSRCGEESCSESLADYLTRYCSAGTATLATIDDTCRDRKAPRTLEYHFSASNVCSTSSAFVMSLSLLFTAYQAFFGPFR